MTASRLFIVEPAFYEHDKNHKFDHFKTHKNLFFNEVLHCIAWKVSVSLYIQCECGKMQTLFMQCCAVKDAN